MPPCCWPGDEQRVEDAAAVVDRDVAQQLDPAGLAVDLDDRDVRAERERRRARRRSRARARGAPPCSRAGASSSLHRRREVGPRQRARGHARRPGARRSPSDDVVGVRLEQVRGELLGLGQHLVARDLAARCRAICSEREPPVPPPCGMSVGVGLEDRDLLHRHAEHVARRSSRTRSRDPGRASSSRRTRGRCRRPRSRPCPTPGTGRPAR